jgi:ApbE superfamily uncharacterized protein (UPF0280 family)
MGAEMAYLSGDRLHLQEGPIDLIIKAFGSHTAIARAYDAAGRRFEGLLARLCDELPLLRSPVGPLSAPPQGAVARRMHDAVQPYAEIGFITPMAAVAGAVAEEIMSAMVAAAELTRAYVNNGGDIALYLAGGESFDIGLVARPDRPALFANVEVTAEQPVRGVATSGWRGRSFSLGIADAVTVLASSAARADAAATMIANAVDLPGHPAVQRVPARQIQPDNDLGARLVTRGVGHLGRDEIDDALARGSETAEWARSRGLIEAAALYLQGVTQFVGTGNSATRRRLLTHA